MYLTRFRLAQYRFRVTHVLFSLVVSLVFSLWRRREGREQTGMGFAGVDSWILGNLVPATVKASIKLNEALGA
jgi:hypothetical protein